jgi:perosamine synthetase
MSKRFIPIYQPSLTGREKELVLDCLESSWISSKGPYISRFEKAFSEFVGIRYALGVCNGTAAVHLALLALGIGPGDEVIVPTLTYIVFANPIMMVGATPVFADSLRDTWQVDPESIRRKITPRTRAIMVVHLYGLPADMDSIMALARAHGLKVIEDCAEAIGSRMDGRHVGTFGDISAFSFFGNKTITTGEGGMVVTHKADLADLVDRYKGQGLARNRVYWHDLVGYNYRMTNICAAIGCAQMERIEDTIARKKELAHAYDSLLDGSPLETHRVPCSRYEHSYWMYSVLVQANTRDMIMEKLKEDGIETRPLFYPIHSMPMYYKAGENYPVAEELSQRGINLPSWPNLPESDRQFITERLLTCIKSFS